jgi:hypothetical protein
MIKIVLLLIGSINIFSEYPYETIGETFSEDREMFEVKNMTPTKSQDGIGVCYGFSSTSLLENYRCRELKLNCLDKKEQLSSLDVTSYYLDTHSRQIKEAGNSSTLLNNFKRSKKKLAFEECANFSSLLHQSNQNGISNEKEGFNLLIKAWNKFKGYADEKKSDCVSCLVQELKAKLKNLKTPDEQIKNAFYNSESLENFIYNATLPLECLDQNKMASVPDFDVNRFPRFGSTPSLVELKNKIEQVLLNDIPIEISICTANISSGECPDGEGHSTTLFGVKEACDPGTNNCKTLVRIKNSYGWGWQRDHNNGWVDLDTLAQASMNLDTHSNITWLQKPGTKLENKVLKKTGSYSNSSTRPQGTYNTNTKPIPLPPEYKNFKGIWKCPGNKFLDHFEDGCVPYMKM